MKRHEIIIALALVAALFVWLQFGPNPNETFAETTVTLQDGLSSYTGTTDTDLNTYSPTANTGSATILRALGYGEVKPLLRFDLSSIPANATINSATLSVYVPSNNGNGGGDEVSLYRVLKNWQELQATWNVYSSGNNWSVAGLGSGTDHETSGVTISVGYVPTNVWANFPVTSMVQKWVNGTNPNYGVTIFPSNGPQLNMRSSEYATNPLLRPKLFVDYTN